MKLAEYMTLKSITDDEMGALLGKDRSVVTKYRGGKVKPKLSTIARLDEITNGAVSFRDFLPKQRKKA